ncbi:MAG TPA: hypothetical protein DHV30_09675, partial [Balneola sp.]|nr:hypothetical protein [Balneola sp.]
MSLASFSKFLFSAFIFSCFSLQIIAQDTGSSAQQEETVVLQLKWYHQFQFAGYYAASIKGFYAEEGLNVQINEGHPLSR